MVAADGTDSVIRRQLAPETAGGQLRLRRLAGGDPLVPGARAARRPADRPARSLGAGYRFVAASLGERGSSGGSTPGRHLLGGHRRRRAPAGAAGDPARPAAPLVRGLARADRRAARRPPTRATWSSRRSASCGRCPARTASRSGRAGWCCSATPRTPCRRTSARAPAWPSRTRPRSPSLLREARLPDAVQAYDRVRRPRAATVVRQTRRMSAVLQARGRLALRARDAALGTISSAAALHRRPATSAAQLAPPGLTGGAASGVRRSGAGRARRCRRCRCGGSRPAGRPGRSSSLPAERKTTSVPAASSSPGQGGGERGAQPAAAGGRQGGHPGDLGDVADPHRHAAGQRALGRRRRPARRSAGRRRCRARSSSSAASVQLGRPRRPARPGRPSPRRGAGGAERRRRRPPGWAATSAAKPGESAVQHPHRYVGRASPGRAARPGRAPSAAPRSTSQPGRAGHGQQVRAWSRAPTRRPPAGPARAAGPGPRSRRRATAVRWRRAGAGRRTANRRPSRTNSTSPPMFLAHRRRRGAPRRRSVPTGRRRRVVQRIHRARLHVPDSGRCDQSRRGLAPGQP